MTTLCSEPIQMLVAQSPNGDERVYLDLCTHHTDESPCPQHPKEEPDDDHNRS